MKFFTLHSIYEIDFDKKQIRRTLGNHPATRHFSPDGDWKPYHEVDGIEIGSPHPRVIWPDGTATLFSGIRALQPRLFNINEDGVQYHSEDEVPFDLWEPA